MDPNVINCGHTWVAIYHAEDKAIELSRDAKDSGALQMIPSDRRRFVVLVPKAFPTFDLLVRPTPYQPAVQPCPALDLSWQHW